MSHALSIDEIIALLPANCDFRNFSYDKKKRIWEAWSTLSTKPAKEGKVIYGYTIRGHGKTPEEAINSMLCTLKSYAPKLFEGDGNDTNVGR